MLKLIDSLETHGLVEVASDAHVPLSVEWQSGGVYAFYRPPSPAGGVGCEFALDAVDLATWDNKMEVVSTYVLRQSIEVYMGAVAGGSGVQVLLPRGTQPLSVVRLIRTESLMP